MDIAAPGGGGDTADRRTHAGRTPPGSTPTRPRGHRRRRARSRTGSGQVFGLAGTPGLAEPDTYWPSLPGPVPDPVRMTAVVPTHRCGAVPELACLRAEQASASAPGSLLRRHCLADTGRTDCATSLSAPGSLADIRSAQPAIEQPRTTRTRTPDGRVLRDRQTCPMKRVLIIGVGAGDPEHLTLQAVKAIRRADVFFLLDKGRRRPSCSVAAGHDRGVCRATAPRRPRP